MFQQDVQVSIETVYIVTDCKDDIIVVGSKCRRIFIERANGVDELELSSGDHKFADFR